MVHTNVLMQASRLLEHRALAIQVAESYGNINWMTITKLANSFNVSENTITELLCEAVANRYIASDLMCSKIMQKHIAEYEKKHNLSDSYLRLKYRSALTKRSKTSTVLDIDSILQKV